MQSPPWGNLRKSQVDPQLITEAIDSAISAHNADPEAHIGDTESLGVHRKSTIIDHFAGSVVPDKFDSVQKQFMTCWETLGGAQVQGHASANFMNLSMVVFGNDTQDTYLNQEAVVFSSNDDYTPKQNYLDFEFDYSAFYDIADVYIGIGVRDAVPSLDEYTMAVKIHAGEISYAIATSNPGSWGGTETLSQNTKHVVRFETSEEFKEGYILLDGVLKLTVDLSTLTDWNYTTFGVYMKKTGGTTNAQALPLNSHWLAFWNPNM